MAKPLKCHIWGTWFKNGLKMYKGCILCGKRVYFKSRKEM